MVKDEALEAGLTGAATAAVGLAAPPNLVGAAAAVAMPFIDTMLDDESKSEGKKRGRKHAGPGIRKNLRRSSSLKTVNRQKKELRKPIAQSLRPGDIVTQPGTKMVFNGPYDEDNKHQIKDEPNSAGKQRGRKHAGPGIRKNLRRSSSLKTVNRQKKELRKPIAQSLRPGDIVTQPGTKMVFNGPYDEDNKHQIKDEPNSAGKQRGRKHAGPGIRKNLRRSSSLKTVNRQKKELRKPIAQSLRPGDIVTQPGTKMVFNGPYDEDNKHQIKIVNSSANRIGWAVKTNNLKIRFQPAFCVLHPEEAIRMAVFCDAIANGQKGPHDRITIEWTNIPDEAAMQFRREWFLGGGIVGRKCLPIEYNP